jgi:hypothetical protein
MKRRCLLLVAVLAGCGGLWCVSAETRVPDAPVPNARPQLMRAKLIHCQKVLEALTVEDYPAMAKHARQLKLLSQDASWEVFRGIEYEQQSVVFRRTTDALSASAEARNLDGATLAYVQLTMSCVNCHKYVRSQKATPP